MTSHAPFNKLLYASTSGPPSEGQSEISSVDSDWSDIRAIAIRLDVANPNDLFTERFKVDRQKLENMIKTDGTTEGLNSAEQFFENVMDSTKTYISWPCRLKIGAKTKKDPHVRIVGKPEDVQRAKERILVSLDSRGTRVIMKMDVSYTDHSYIIGRGGNNIKRIMDETATHIHFPDSNRSNPMEKSNQVSLCGSLEGVEKARSLVRSSTPVLISFELPILAPGRPVPDHETPYIKEVEAKYNVQVIFSSRPKLHSSLVLVKGLEKEAQRVQEATQLLINFTCENVANQILVHMQLEISPQHHDVVKGLNSTNLLSIMERTKTKIIFPDVNDMNIKAIKKSQVSVTGTIDGVYKARQLLIGNLPIAIIFDYPDSAADTSQIMNLSNKYGVFIILRQKQRQSTVVVVIKGVEKFIDKVYEARHEVLKLQTPIVKPEVPATYFSPKDLEMEVSYRRNLTSLLSSYPESPLTPGFPMIPSYNNTNNNINAFPKFQGTLTGVCTPNPKLMQSNNYHRTNQLPTTTTNNNHLNGTINHNTSVSSGGNGNGPLASGNYLTVPSQLPPQLVSPRSSGNTSGYQSFSSSTNSLEQTYSGSYGNIPTTLRQYSPDSNYGSDRGRRLSDGSMYSAGTNVHDYRSTPHYDLRQRGLDFDVQRVVGFRAMERSPQGELRTPNSNWIGLGLSRTSPLPLETNPQTGAGTSNEMAWNRGQLSPYNLGVTTGLVDSTPTNRRDQIPHYKDIHSLLTNFGLEHYIKTFVLNEIDLDMFSTLTEDNLIELGIAAFGARKKLLVAIHSLAVSQSAGYKLASNSSPRFSGSAAPGAERRSSGW